MLEGIEWFEGLSPSEKTTLALFCQDRVLADNEVLFSEGDEAIAMYVVKSGVLKAYKSRSSGETVLGYVRAGEVVGEIALFGREGKIRMASVKAVEPTKLLVLVDYAIFEISKKHPDLYAKISAIVAKRQSENASK